MMISEKNSMLFIEFVEIKYGKRSFISCLIAVSTHAFHLRMLWMKCIKEQEELNVLL